VTQRKTSKPKAVRTPVVPPSPQTLPVDGLNATALAVARAGLARKAHDVVVLDVRKLASYAEYFVVMTADSDRQLAAVAEQIEDDLGQAERYPFGVEGIRGGRWVLVDFGDVVAHVFHRDVRGFYDLEGLWSDAPRYEVND
jgi:ribosome-associated protein